MNIVSDNSHNSLESSSCYGCGLHLLQKCSCNTSLANEASVSQDRLSSMSDESVLKSTTSTSCVAYIYGKDFIRRCNQLPKVSGRPALVHSLIESYNLLENVKIVEPIVASYDDLTQFHSRDYIDYLKQFNDSCDQYEYNEESDLFGIGYDCPLYSGIYDSCKSIAGGSLTAAECLLNGEANVAINWLGGWHHGKRDSASGFCYINDIVLCILRLLSKFSRVLYVDLDLHHGDGVQDAFCATGRVMFVSLHKCSNGFFPGHRVHLINTGTGKVSECGIGKGRYHSVNIPLKDGTDDKTFTNVFAKIIEMVKDVFNPDVVVCQCGADALAGDPLSCGNLTHASLVNCVQLLLSLRCPTVLLGGGGYNFANTARSWTAVTASVVGRELSNDIPEHEFFTSYGPGYELAVQPGYMRNLNTSDYLDGLISIVESNLNNLRVSKKC